MVDLKGSDKGLVTKEQKVTSEALSMKADIMILTETNKKREMLRIISRVYAYDVR
jgi:hypothetical protein